MFITKKENLSNRVERYKIYHNDLQLTYSEMIELLKKEADFRLLYNNILVESSFKAFFWENPSITRQSIHQPYEFVLVESKQLSRVEADNSTFEPFFYQNTSAVVCFKNLGKDALLVVPKPIGQLQYPHIAYFVRNAPKEQVHEFWQQVGEQVDKRIHQEKLWVSTSGLGVYWLHVRLDSRPKYYTYRPYR